jgi:hypothetical protein
MVVMLETRFHTILVLLIGVLKFVYLASNDVIFKLRSTMKRRSAGG